MHKNETKSKISNNTVVLQSKTNRMTLFVINIKSLNLYSVSLTYGVKVGISQKLRYGHELNITKKHINLIQHLTIYRA